MLAEPGSAKEWRLYTVHATCYVSRDNYYISIILVYQQVCDTNMSLARRL